MKLISYRRDRGHWRSGVLVGALVVDAQKCAASGAVPAADSVRGILESLGPGELRELGTAASAVASHDGVPVGDVELGPPVPDPQKIVCIGLTTVRTSRS